jgi:hypothetical protein
LHPIARISGTVNTGANKIQNRWGSENGNEFSGMINVISNQHMNGWCRASGFPQNLPHMTTANSDTLFHQVYPFSKFRPDSADSRIARGSGRYKYRVESDFYRWWIDLINSMTLLWGGAGLSCKGQHPHHRIYGMIDPMR